MKYDIKRKLSPQRSGSVLLWSDSLTITPRLTQLIESINHPDRLEALDCTPLKHALRRAVLRLDHYSATLPSIILKGFPLQKLESRLKYQRYGMAEVNNYREAQTLQLPTPECFGYFELRRWGTVAANGVFIEDLRGYSTLHDLAESNRDQPSERAKLFARAIPAIRQLFDAGANHIDTTAHNFMLSPDQTELKVIDWQYASFHPPKHPIQLILQATQFLRYTELTEENSSEWTDWLRNLYDTCAPLCTWELFRNNVRDLQSKKRASNPSRLDLSVALPHPLPSPPPNPLS